MKKNYLSREGYEELREELHKLKTSERRRIAQTIAEAREKGDLSENAEYDAAKEEQGKLEARIADLEKKLANAQILEEEDVNIDKAYLLSTVTILNKNTDKEMQYKLVSADESDIKQNKLSIESPIGKAILGQEEGDVVNVDVPAGTLELEILSIDR